MADIKNNMPIADALALLKNIGYLPDLDDESRGLIGILCSSYEITLKYVLCSTNSEHARATIDYTQTFSDTLATHRERYWDAFEYGESFVTRNKPMVPVRDPQPAPVVYDAIENANADNSSSSSNPDGDNSSSSSNSDAGGNVDELQDALHREIYEGMIERNSLF
jgi:hypothetical protein